MKKQDNGFNSKSAVSRNIQKGILQNCSKKHLLGSNIPPTTPSENTCP